MIHNPILTGFHPDPSILRVGEEYFLVTSSFEWLPALPIYRSTDLEHWELVCHALLEERDLQGISSACGIWAPALSFSAENQLFYLSYSLVYGFQQNNFDIENFVITATHPRDTWSKPKYLSSSGFDPSFFHDVDGKSYVVSLEWEFRQHYTHPGRIILQEYDREKSILVGNVHILSTGASKRGCAEGPNLYYRNGFYYLLIAEGGTGYGHCTTVSRATKVTGPYEPAPNNPLLTSYREDFDEIGIPNSAKPWRYAKGQVLQKAGHGNLVETPEGETYCTHLLSRPIGEEHYSVLGRETGIQQCIWKDDWIFLNNGDIIAEEYTPKPRNTRPSSCYPAKEGVVHDDFTQNIPNYYYAPRCPLSDEWVKVTKEGLSLRGRGSLFGKYHTSLLARKSNAFSFQVDTKLVTKPENHLQMAGLTNYYNNENFYFLRLYYSQSHDSLALGILEGKQGAREEYTKYSVKLKEFNCIYLRAVVDYEELQYYYSYDDKLFYPIGPVLPMGILSDEFAGGFTGSFVGLIATDMMYQTWEATFPYLTYTNKPS
ncbi:MAG: family 43 glycosylhydrolase [Eubacteriales bacterium]